MYLVICLSFIISGTSIYYCVNNINHKNIENCFEKIDNKFNKFKNKISKNVNSFIENLDKPSFDKELLELKIKSNLNKSDNSSIESEISDFPNVNSNSEEEFILLYDE